MTMKKIFIIITFITITLLAFAGPVQELMELAESAFSKGDYIKARGYYVDIVNLQSATDEQRNDARFNINVCQGRINDDLYNTGYTRAMSLFNGKQFVQSRNTCFGLLKYGKYKSKTNRLIQQCNDSINARFIAQQAADSVQRINQLSEEYNAIVEEALAYFNSKHYLEAINTCKKSFDSKFDPLGEAIPSWFYKSFEIYSAQCKGKAITPEFAQSLKNAIAIGDVNDGIARIVYRNNQKDSTMYISLNGDIKIIGSGHITDDFRCGFLGTRYGQGVGYHDTLGKYYSIEYISGLNYLPVYGIGEYICDVREFSGGRAPFLHSNGKWGYLNDEFKVWIEPQYDFVTAFSEGKAFVRKKGKWLIIDQSGTVIKSKLYPAFHGSAYESKTGYCPYVNNSYYSDGKIWVQTFKYKNVLLDRWGEIILNEGDYEVNSILHNGSPLHEWITFSEGLIIYRNNNNKYGFMDATGRVVITPAYDLTYGFKDGMAGIKLNNKWGFIDKLGKVIIQPSFEAISRDGFSEGLCAAQSDGKWGFIDKSGDWIIEPIYDNPYRVLNASVGSFHEGFAAVSLDGQLGYVDKFGNSTFDF